MPSIRRNLFTKTYCTFGLESRIMLAAATNAESFREGLAGTDDTINVNAEQISFDQQVGIERPVTIQAGPEFEGTRPELRFSEDADVEKHAPLLDVRSDDVQLHDLTLTGAGPGNDSGVVQLNQAGGDTSNGFTADEVTFQDADKGIVSRGNIPQDLTVTDSDFQDTPRGIDIGRNAKIGTGDFRDGGKLDISGNTFDENTINGINIDAGNDGVNEGPVSGFDDPSGREQFTDQTTVFDEGSRIANNTVKGSQEFGIAAATVENIEIEGNNVQTNGVAEGNNGFSSGINVEHNSRDVNVRDNTIDVDRTAPGDGIAAGITVGPHQDHGAAASFEQASEDIEITGNTFEGGGNDGNVPVFINSAKDVTVGSETGDPELANDFEGFTDAPDAPLDVSISDAPDGTSDVTVAGNSSNRVFQSEIPSDKVSDPSPNGDNLPT